MGWRRPGASFRPQAVARQLFAEELYLTDVGPSCFRTGQRPGGRAPPGRKATAKCAHARWLIPVHPANPRAGCETNRLR